LGVALFGAVWEIQALATKISLRLKRCRQ